MKERVTYQAVSVDSRFLPKLKEISAKKTADLGYRVGLSDLIRESVRDLLKKYKVEI
jgi:hypothetical protein